MAAPVRIVFLGGLGEIGRNCMAIVQTDEHQADKILLIDCGLMFPDADMHGIDLVLPDFTWLREQADKIFDENAAKFDAQEKEAIEFFKKEGKQVYTPDQNAFRAFAQKRYLDKYAAEWPKGALEKINAIK